MVSCSSVQNLSRRQWLTLLIFSLGNLCKSSGDALMGPLYPPLAEQKGASSSLYGLVLGTYNLTVMIVSLVVSRYLEVIGPKFVFGESMFILGVTNMIFGFIMYEDVKLTFIILSFTVRIIASFGAAGFSATKNCLIAREFKNNSGAIFSILEIFLGLGLAAGPSIGTLLSEYGGFVLPFVTLGGIQILATALVVMLMPGDEPNEELQGPRIGFLKALQVPSIVIFFYAVVSASASIGFLDVGLEEHLQEQGFSAMSIGLMFMLRGLAFALSSPLLGFLCDKFCPPSFVVLLSGSLSLLGFLLIGPAPFLPSHSGSSPLIVMSLFLIGAGGGGELTGAYTGAFRAALSAGFPDCLSTYGLISGLFSASFYLGWFLGPSFGGVLISNIGFGWTSTVFLAIHALVCLFSAVRLGAKCSWKRSENIEVCITLETNRLLSKKQSYGSIEVY